MRDFPSNSLVNTDSEVSGDSNYQDYKSMRRKHGIKRVAKRAPLVASTLAIMLIVPLAIIHFTSDTPKDSKPEAPTVSLKAKHQSVAQAISGAGTSTLANADGPHGIDGNDTNSGTNTGNIGSRPHGITVHPIHRLASTIHSSASVATNSSSTSQPVANKSIAYTGGVSVPSQHVTSPTHISSGGVSPSTGNHGHSNNSGQNHGNGVHNGNSSGGLSPAGHNGGHHTGHSNGGVSPSTNNSGHSGQNNSGGVQVGSSNNHNQHPSNSQNGSHIGNNSNNGSNGQNHTNNGNHGGNNGNGGHNGPVQQGPSVHAPDAPYVGGPRHFVDYNQGDWGARLAASGCGPTSAAMVVSTLTGRNVNPAEMAAQLSPKYYIPGSGTTTAAFPYIGKKHTSIKVNHINGFGDVNRTLRDGGLVIVHAKPGHFTTAGHYMVIRFVNKSGDRYTLADPNTAPGRDSETKTWTASQLRANGIDDLWAFTPRR